MSKVCQTDPTEGKCDFIQNVKNRSESERDPGLEILYLNEFNRKQFFFLLDVYKMHIKDAYKINNV